MTRLDELKEALEELNKAPVFGVPAAAKKVGEKIDAVMRDIDNRLIRVEELLEIWE